VPGRRDIGVRAREDRHGVARRRRPPLRVGARHMTVERALVTLAVVEDHRERRRNDALGRRRDELSKTNLPHPPMNAGEVFFLKARRHVHRFLRAIRSLKWGAYLRIPPRFRFLWNDVLPKIDAESK